MASLRQTCDESAREAMQHQLATQSAAEDARVQATAADMAQARVQELQRSLHTTREQVGELQERVDVLEGELAAARTESVSLVRKKEHAEGKLAARESECVFVSLVGWFVGVGCWVLGVGWCCAVELTMGARWH